LLARQNETTAVLSRLCVEAVRFLCAIAAAILFAVAIGLWVSPLWTTP
jgi:hypothetical protein